MAQHFRNKGPLSGFVVPMNWWNDIVGLPYEKGGRTISGIDCWGLVILIFKKNFPSVELQNYGAVTVDEMKLIAETISDEKKSGTWVDIPHGAEKPFDIVVIPTVALGRMGEFHVGVVTRKGHILHAEEDAGCIESCFRVIDQKRPDRNMRFRRCEIFRHRALA
jgi:probable lipoprotein NlpC